MRLTVKNPYRTKRSVNKMEENKELTETKAETSEEKNVQIDTVEFEEIPAKDEGAAKGQPKGSWWERSVTRKFVILALAAAVLINAALTAGIMGAFVKKQAGDRQNMHGQGRPGSEMFPDDQDGSADMMPPDGDQNGGQEQSSKVSIGIMIKEDSGVYVAQVTGDNAKKAGFREGDKVVSIDGKDVATGNDLVSEVQSHKSGDTVTVTVERDGQPVEIKTELE